MLKIHRFNGITEFVGKHEFLSNAYPATITTADGITYPSIIHAFQAQKSNVVKTRKYVAKLSTSAKALAYGHKLRLPKNWSVIKVSVLTDLLVLKFSDEKLKSLLLATNPAPIQYTNYTGDTFWGVCNGIGENKLGDILAAVRVMVNV